MKDQNANSPAAVAYSANSLLSTASDVRLISVSLELVSQSAKHE